MNNLPPPPNNDYSPLLPPIDKLRNQINQLISKLDDTDQDDYEAKQVVKSSIDEILNILKNEKKEDIIINAFQDTIDVLKEYIESKQKKGGKKRKSNTNRQKKTQNKKRNHTRNQNRNKLRSQRR